MRSKNFNFSFAENISKFIILGRNIGKVRSFCKFCGVSLNVQMLQFKDLRVGQRIEPCIGLT